MLWALLDFRGYYFPEELILLPKQRTRNPSFFMLCTNYDG